MNEYVNPLNGVPVSAVRKLVCETYNLHHSWPVKVELMDVYSDNELDYTAVSYEFKATFQYRTDWVDEKTVSKIITISMRDAD